jgi:hypothetical protein
MGLQHLFEKLFDNKIENHLYTVATEPESSKSATGSYSELGLYTPLRINHLPKINLNITYPSPPRCLKWLLIVEPHEFCMHSLPILTSVILLCKQRLMYSYTNHRVSL